MKKYLITLLVIFSCELIVAQNNTLKAASSTKHHYSVNDTIPEVVKPDDWEINFPIIEVNKKFSSKEILATIKPQDIASVEVDKDINHINEKNYHGKIIVTLKPNIKITLITVAELVSKYTDLKKGENYIFSIDGEIINDDEKSALVDERNIMQMKVVKLDHLKSFQNLSLVKILTRTETNISKANEILIR